MLFLILASERNRKGEGEIYTIKDIKHIMSQGPCLRKMSLVSHSLATI